MENHKIQVPNHQPDVKHWMILDVCFVAQRGHCGHGDIITRVWMLETLEMNASPSHVAKQHQ